MKKTTSIILVCMFFIAIFIPGVNATKNCEVGDVIGESLTTDIVARINGYDIKSYNVSDHTYIMAEELKNYGFDVHYVDAERALYVNRNEGKTTVTSSYQKVYKDVNERRIKEFDIIYTDIKTYVEGNEVESFNIGGQTLIRFDCLAAYSEVSYNDIVREIKVNLPWLKNNPESFESRLENLYSSLDEKERAAAKTFFSDQYYKYYDYMKKSYDAGRVNYDDFDFERGLILADLNDDSIPELFSMTWDKDVAGCELVDGKVTLTAEENHFGYINERLEKVPNKYMNDSSFCGIYRHKETGEKAIIAYREDNDAYDGISLEEFKIVTFDGEKFHSKNRYGEDVDLVMADYIELDEKFVSSYTIRGVMRSFYALEDDAIRFYLNEKEEYAQPADGEDYYYIRNFDEEKMELSLIPVRKITMEEHKQAVLQKENNDIYITEDGFAMKPDTDMSYAAGDFYTTVEYYSYTEPWEDEPGVVLGYMKNTAVKVSVPENFEVTYCYGGPEEVKMYDALDYFRNFSKYDNNNYYRAVIKNGAITELECVYHP